jgi:hypothetical protein
MQDINRRDAATWALGGCLSLFAACGGGGGAQAFADAPSEPTSPAPGPAPAPAPGPVAPPPSAPAPVTPAAPPAWNLAQILSFVAGTATTVQLADTLPSGVARGGRFSVGAAGAPLPSGATLSASGALSVSAATPVSATSGVIFEYSEP